MTTVIYADVLVAVNIYVTYFLLISVRALLKLKTKKYSVGISSVIGGLTSLFVLAEPVNTFFQIIIKLLFAFIIVYIAFLPKTVKGILKNTAVFLGISVAFGGIMLLFENTVHPNGMVYINGTVYFDVSIKFLVAVTLIGYGCVTVFDRIMRSRISEKTLFETEVFFRGKSVKVKSFYDTGNKCRDGLDGKPVIFIELSSVKKLFSREEADYIENYVYGIEPPEGLKRYVRVTVCTAVSGNGIFFSFIPDKVIINDGKKQFETSFCACAVVNKSVSDGEYTAILNCDIFERGKYDV